MNDKSSFGKKKCRRSGQVRIIEALFKVLNDGRTHTAQEVSKLSEVSWNTVVSWMDLIVTIQEKPRIERERVGRTNLYHMPFTRRV